MSAVRSMTLADVAMPRAGWIVNTLLVIAASFVTAAAAQVEIRLPWTPVPVTGQTFAVLLTGAVLGTRRAFLAQMLYLAEGSMGLPVFSGGAAGFAYLLGPTGGYLMAFPFAAAVTGRLAERGWDKHFATMFAAMLLGSAVIFAFGLAQLSRFVPSSQLLTAGLLPFVPGDLVKSSLSALAFPATWALVDKVRGGRS